MANQAYENMEDQALMELAAQGNELAFAALMTRYKDGLFGFVWRVTGGGVECEDILQDTYGKIWRYAARYDAKKGASVKTWMFQIAHNAAIDVLRKVKRTSKEFTSETVLDFIETPATQTQEVEAKERLATITDALSDLPESQRMAITLTYFEELSNKEAADAMGVTVKAIESLLVRARKKLKHSLAALAPQENEYA